MANEQVAYLDSSRHSEQLSCRKHFHRSYCLFIMIFQVLNGFMYLTIFQNRKQNILLSPSAILACVYDSGTSGVWLTQSRADWSTYEQCKWVPRVIAFSLIKW